MFRVNQLVYSLILLAISVNALADERLLSSSDIQVEDGDTIIVTMDGKTHKIQLHGIDAPEDTENPKLKVDLSRTRLEKEQLLALGELSTQQLRYLVNKNATFILHFDPNKVDRYGRIPGDIVNTDGESLSTLMITNGYAIVMTRSTSKELIERLTPLQLVSIVESKGLWGIFPQASRLWAGIK